MSKYFVAEGGRRRGPLSIDELKQNPLSGDSLVWRRGLERWVRARDLPELAEVLEPPPLPQTPPSSLAPTEFQKGKSVDQGALHNGRSGGATQSASPLSMTEWFLLPIAASFNKYIFLSSVCCGSLIYHFARDIPNYDHALHDSIIGGLLFVGGASAFLMTVTALGWAFAKPSAGLPATPPRWLSLSLSACPAARRKTSSFASTASRPALSRC